MSDVSSPFAQVGTRNPSTNDGLLYINGKWVPSNIGQGIPAAQSNTSAYVGIPLLPKHDDEWVYQASVGVYWRFKYDVYTGYWNFIGGTPIHVFQNASIPMSAGSTFTNINPVFNMPFAGDYTIRANALVNNQTTTADCLLGLAAAGASLGRYGQARLSGNESGSLYVDDLWTGWTIGQQVNPMGWTNNPTPGNTGFQWIHMYVTPTRVH